MNKEKLKVEARKVEQAVELAYQKGGIDRSLALALAIDVKNLINCINELDDPEVEQLYKKIRELESYNNALIRDNYYLRIAIEGNV